MITDPRTGNVLASSATDARRREPAAACATQPPRAPRARKCSPPARATSIKAGDRAPLGRSPGLALVGHSVAGARRGRRAALRADDLPGPAPAAHRRPQPRVRGRRDHRRGRLRDSHHEQSYHCARSSDFPRVRPMCTSRTASSKAIRARCPRPTARRSTPSVHIQGLSRRLDTATFHDLGGTVWN